MIVFSSPQPVVPMPRTKTLLLLHPFFLLNLFLLVANDHWWKHEYANGLTGKISDFAGVFVMAVCLIACCRFKKITAIIFTVLFFTWWKSPLSEPFIVIFGLARVVDYSDLMALTILPVVFYLKPFHYVKLPVKYAIPFVAVIAWTAMVATSLPYTVGGYYYPQGHVKIDKRWTTKLTEEEFLHKLDSLHITWTTDSSEYLPVRTRGLLMVMKSEQDSTYHMTEVDDIKDTLFYYKKQLGKHYLIPYLALTKDTLINVRFRFHNDKRRRVVELMEMTIPADMSYYYYLERSERKRYEALMKTFMLGKY